MFHLFFSSLCAVATSSEAPVQFLSVVLLM